jgi:hypothetical protein
MKLLAQHGFGDGNKINDGLKKKLIDGVIFSPRDINPEKLKEKLKVLRKDYRNIELLFDPQLYITTLGQDNAPNTGKLLDYDYFKFYRKSDLEKETIIKNVIRSTFEQQIDFPFTSILSPNILISKSFDSRESVISKNFIRLSKSVLNEFSDKRDLYVTLAISRDTLANKEELKEFLNDITLLDNPPIGFYLLISTRSSDARTDIFNLNVISGWMFLNYVLNLNGFKIINGYSDIISMFLGAVGGDYGCTGWWSNLRIFSLDRFTQNQSGGKIPIQRYLSVKLLNRITHFEYKDWKKIFPEIKNNLINDIIFDNDEEPDRSQEIIQSWESIKFLLNEIKSKDIEKNLNVCTEYIRNANKLYTKIRTSFRPGPKSNNDHLEPLSEGINKFVELAELNFKF